MSTEVKITGQDWLLEMYRQLFKERRTYEKYSWQICVAMLAVAGVGLGGIAALSSKLGGSPAVISAGLFIIAGAELASAFIIGRFHVQRDYCYREIMKIQYWLYQNEQDIPMLDVAMETKGIDQFRRMDATPINRVFGLLSTTGIALFIILLVSISLVVAGLITLLA